VKKLRSEPNEQGFWGDYGGRFVAETLIAPLEELTTAYRAARRDRDFRRQLDNLRRNYSGLSHVAPCRTRFLADLLEAVFKSPLT